MVLKGDLCLVSAIVDGEGIEFDLYDTFVLGFVMKMMIIRH